MTKKPVIGVIEWAYQDIDRDPIFEVVRPVVSKVIKHGGIVRGIFPTQDVDYDQRLRYIPKFTKAELDELFEQLDQCDAIIKPGATKTYEFERHVYEHAVEKDIPFLGICAGMQMMCHYQKERIQNEKNDPYGMEHHTTRLHPVAIEEDSLLYQILGVHTIMVNSFHNTHVLDSGVLVPCAYSQDGLIEAVEHPDCRFSLGVQWHPESMNDRSSDLLFEGLVEAADITKTLTKKK